MKNLKTLRKDNSITLERLSKQIGISNQMLSNYELNKVNPPLENIIKIADYFDVSLDYLCGRQNSNLIFVDSLTTEQRKLIELIKRLNNDQVNVAIGYFSNMLNLPYTDIKSHLSDKKR